MIDLSAEQLRKVRRVLAEHAEEFEAYAYGSRIDGDARKFSDLDLALLGSEPIDWRRIEELKDAFSASDLPFTVDVTDLRSVTPEFRKIIEEKMELVREASGRTAR